MNRRDFLKMGIGAAFGAFLSWAGLVKAEPDPPVLYEDKTTATLFGYPVIWREEPETIVLTARENPYTTVWLDGLDVSEYATACEASPTPGATMWGWVELLVGAESNHICVDENGNPLKYKRWGSVKWEPMEWEPME